MWKCRTWACFGLNKCRTWQGLYDCSSTEYAGQPLSNPTSQHRIAQSRSFSQGLLPSNGFIRACKRYEQQPTTDHIRGKWLTMDANRLVPRQ